jgi:hypothetical protein
MIGPGLEDELSRNAAAVTVGLDSAMQGERVHDALRRLDLQPLLNRCSTLPPVCTSPAATRGLLLSTVAVNRGSRIISGLASVGLSITKDRNCSTFPLVKTQNGRFPSR